MKYDKSFPKSAKGMHAWTKIHFCFKNKTKETSPQQRIWKSLSRFGYVSDVCLNPAVYHLGGSNALFQGILLGDNILANYPSKQRHSYDAVGIYFKMKKKIVSLSLRRPDLCEW